MKIKSLNKLVFSVMIFTILSIPNLAVFAEKNYHLEIDENSFDIKYNFNGDVIAMAIDKESTSLLIATENVRDTQFQITLPEDLIHANNNAFAVLVNGYEVEYTITNTKDTVLTFFVPDFTEEIEIIGTYIVPEFPLGVILVFGSTLGIIITLLKTKKFSFR